MVAAVLITTLWLSLIIGARYLLVAGGVWWLTWGRAWRWPARWRWIPRA